MKKSILIFKTLVLSSFLFAFDFPFDDIAQDAFAMNFGEFSGETINTSLKFTREGNVKALDDGKLILVMTDEDDESRFFPSTLGSSIYISHKDGIMSIYGNLDKTSITSEFIDESVITKGEVIASTGKSGWQDVKSTLELQVLDVTSGTAVNPRTLLPRIEKEKRIVNGEITLLNKDGRYTSLAATRTFPSGVYKVYERRVGNYTVYKTYTGINGDIQEVISYDSVRGDNNQLYINGQSKKYPGTVVYPDDKLHLLGEVNLKPGKSILLIEQENLLGEKATNNYNISAY